MAGFLEPPERDEEFDRVVNRLRKKMNDAAEAELRLQEDRIAGRRFLDGMPTKIRLMSTVSPFALAAGGAV